MMVVIIPPTSTIIYACVTTVATRAATSAVGVYVGTYILRSTFKYLSNSNTVSKYAEEYGIYEAKKRLANNTYDLVKSKFGKTTADVSSHLVNKFPEALEDAIILDGLLFLVLGAPVIYPIIGATIAYDVRKAANEYFEKDAVVKNVGVGAVAGIVKYGIAGLTLDKKTLLIGAMNNGLYEYFKPEVGDTVGNLDVIGLQASLFQIEGTDAILKKMLTENVNLKSELLTTLKVTALLSASLWLFLQNKELHKLNFTNYERVPNHFNKICNDILGQKCHEYAYDCASKMLSKEETQNELITSRENNTDGEQVCYRNQTNSFKDVDVCYINELAIFDDQKPESVKDEF